MTRYFYTDPLAAAWMAKHFGMMFGIMHNGTVHWNCIGRLYEPFAPLKTPEDILDPISDHTTFYVHPESLHLLEPQEGDFCYVVKVGETDELAINWAARDKKRDFAEITIILRKGVPFMYPESEDA